MLDYQAVRENRLKLADLAAGLTRDDLRCELDAMYAEVARLAADAGDADVTFQPRDPAANDPYAADHLGQIEDILQQSKRRLP